MKLFKQLCKQNQQGKFNLICSRLDEFTKQQVRERRAAETGGTIDVMEPQGLCDLPEIDPLDTKRKKGQRIKKFSEWIEKEPFVKWPCCMTPMERGTTS